MKPTFAIFIPARYGSSRFPGKPLAKIGGTEMIVRVCRQASKACDNVVVATDDDRIRDCVIANGFQAVLTSPDHRSGTDRIQEAYQKSGLDVDVIINVQGDEPFIRPEQIKTLMGCFDSNGQVKLATLVKKFDPAKGFETLFDPNLVKVVRGYDGEALYFSRSVIPYVRGVEWQQWLSTTDYFTHIGIYGYRAATLKLITSLPPSTLEKAESLEQLRWLQNGLRIMTAVTDFETVGIDTPEDLAAAESFLPPD